MPVLVKRINKMFNMLFLVFKFLLKLSKYFDYLFVPILSSIRFLQRMNTIMIKNLFLIRYLNWRKFCNDLWNHPSFEPVFACTRISTTKSGFLDMDPVEHFQMNHVRNNSSRMRGTSKITDFIGSWKKHTTSLNIMYIFTIGTQSLF